MYFFSLFARKERRKATTRFVIAQAHMLCDIINVINIVTFSQFDHVGIEA